MRRVVARAVLAGAGAAVACVAWGTVVEREWYVLRHATVPVLRGPALAPLRVLHVSDLHLLPGHARVARFLDECLSAGPDLVVATGDLVGSPDMIEEAVGLLARVRGDRPGLVVLGSNDLYGPRPKNPLDYFLAPGRRRVGVPIDVDRLREGLRDTGWELLEDRRVRLGTRSGPVEVVGLSDPHIDLDRPERVDWSPPTGDEALRLGVVHAPYLRSLDAFDRHAYDLVLAGHTHGGQVRLPLVGALVTNCDLPRDRVRGLSRHGAALWVHVSAGLGHSRYAPYRFACRPEATVLDLVSVE